MSRGLAASTCRRPCRGAGRSSGASERLCSSRDSVGSLRRGENRYVELGMLSKFQEVGVQGLMACYQQYTLFFL